MRSQLHAALALALFSCSTPSSRPAEEKATSALQTRVLEATGRCLADDHATFAAAADTLVAAAEKLAAAPEDAAAQTEAQQAWSAAIARWQEIEVRQIGPAGPASSPGGQALRDEVYAWPLISRCAIEQTIDSKGYTDAAFATASLVNVRGLSALDFLLHYQGADNSCTPQATINASGSWASISATELRARKAAYARAVAAAVQAQARKLSEAWAADKGNFAGQLASAGPTSALYPSGQKAINAVTDALITYVDKLTKDQKLGRPAGVVDCTAPTCPEALESRFARRSKQHLAANLLGARKVLFGCSEGADAIDDLLTEAGASDLAARLRQALDEAQAAVDAMPDDVEAALASDPAPVKNAHAAVKKLTDLLRNELVIALDLSLPSLVEGDND